MPGGDAHSDAIVRREREIRDREAARYDDHRDRDRYHRDVEDAIVLAQADLRPEHLVVDAGCGTGRHLPELLRRSARVVGVDHSNEMLALAREKVAPEERGRLELVEADLRALPLNDCAADRVLCLETLQHLPTHEFRLGAVREFRRVLKPGGVLVVSVYRWLGHIRRKREGFFDSGIYRYAFTARELGALLREAGLTDVRVGGAVVLPSLAERAGIGVGPQARVAFTPVGRHLSHYLVARGVRPSG